MTSKDRKNQTPPTRLLIAELAVPPPQHPTLTDLARISGLSVATVSRSVAGKNRPNERLRRAAERLFGRPADELFAPSTAGDDADE
jgi:transcriptional regulator with XRE-family HTH domain